MSVEIERKFLVTGDFRTDISQSTRITQGYLYSSPKKTIRIRRAGEKAFLTIKGKPNESGTTRYEWEQEIKIEDATTLLKMCEPGMIDKTRHLVPAGKHSYEVDEFHGENEGLVLAEIELTDEHETFVKPIWLGKEVTGDQRYYNAMLAKNPYHNWKEKV